MSTKLPVTPDWDRTDSALIVFSDAADTTPAVLLAVLLEVLADEAVELALEEDAVEEVEDFGAGLKMVLPLPKPTSEAKVPLTVTVSVVFLAVTTNWPLPLSEALT